MLEVFPSDPSELFPRDQLVFTQMERLKQFNITVSILYTKLVNA